ncbi:MAG: LCP family protein [Anaerolineales bacterium]|nr:LCP family protein [Anaerolineales bacterium]
MTKLLAADLNNLGLENVFMPVDPTPTQNGPVFPTATPDGRPPTDWTTILPENSNNSNQPAEPLKLPHNQVNFLLLGSDQRPYEGGFRTDVIMLVSINTESQTVNMVSFPRDLYVYLPGLYSDRINSAMARGGFALLADTLEYNFGVRPDYYGLINFWSFKNLIDTLGGINVQVGRTLSDQRTGYGTYTVYPGSVNMNGETTLWYVRSRYTTSDFDRARRQQEVVTALVRRLLSFDVVTKFPTLYNQFQGIIETNLPLAEVTPFLPLADELFNGDYGTYVVDESLVTHWRTPSGSAVLLPNQEAIQTLLVTALGVE